MTTRLQLYAQHVARARKLQAPQVGELLVLGTPARQTIIDVLLCCCVAVLLCCCVAVLREKEAGLANMTVLLLCNKRLLEVFKRLRSIGAATGMQATQNELTEEANSIIQEICDDHTFAAEASVQDPELKEALKQDIKNECQELIEYIHASKRFKLEINSRSKDRVISFGERLSCRFMTYVLRDRVSLPPACTLC